MTSGWCYRCADIGKINYENLVWIESERDGRIFPVCESHVKADDIVAKFVPVGEQTTKEKDGSLK